MVDLLQWDLKDAFADGISKELDNLILKPLVIFAEENIPDEYFHENFDEFLLMSTTKAPVIESDQKTPVQSKPEQKATVVKYKKIKFGTKIFHSNGEKLTNFIGTNLENNTIKANQIRNVTFDSNSRDKTMEKNSSVKFNFVVENEINQGIFYIYLHKILIVKLCLINGPAIEDISTKGNYITKDFKIKIPSL